VDPDTGEPTDELHTDVKKLGTKCTTISDVIETDDQAMIDTIEKTIDHYNENLSSVNAEKVKSEMH